MRILVLPILILLATFAVACGDDDDTAQVVIATATPAAGDSTTTGSTGAEATGATTGADSTGSEATGSDNGRLDQEMLQGEWCAQQEGIAIGTTYSFEGDSYQFGVGDTLVPGSDVATFLSSIEVKSLEADSFVVSQPGQETTFTRGGC